MIHDAVLSKHTPNRILQSYVENNGYVSAMVAHVVVEIVLADSNRVVVLSASSNVVVEIFRDDRDRAEGW